MPFNYKSPGVYIEEPPGGARPIESAATAVLALVGLCRETVFIEGPDQKLTVTHPPATPTLVNNWTEFTHTYGPLDQAVPFGYLHDAAFGYFLNGGTAVYVVGLPIPMADDGATRTPPQLPLSEAYLTGPEGQRIVRISGSLKPDEELTVEVLAPEAGAPEGAVSLSIQRKGAEPRVIPNLVLAKQRGQRSIGEVLARETESQLSAEVLEAGALVVGSKATLTPAKAPAAAQPQARAAELRQRITPALFKGDAARRTGIAGLEAIEEVTMLACPDIVAAAKEGLLTPEQVKEVQTSLLDHCDAMKDRFAILDCPAAMGVQEVMSWRKDYVGASKYGALYYPWINANGRLVPPSGHVAGVYARVDAERGVHKAPANEVVRGVTSLERNVSRNEQDQLNPEGVNCIRAFPGQGIRIWGARTLATRSEADWRYINVRRLFSNIEKSILQSTQWIVFEPNDEFLWRQIRRDITAYLTVQWRAGALFGRVPEEAFYVKCDEETNPKEVRDLGYCVIEVGLAPVKPAEFVVFRISQIKDGAGAASE